MNYTYDINKRAAPHILQAFSELKRKEIPIRFLAAELPENQEDGLWYLYTFDYAFEKEGLRVYYTTGMVAEGCYDAISAETDNFAADIAKVVEDHYFEIMNRERIP